MSNQRIPVFQRGYARVLGARLGEPRRFLQVVAGPRQVGKRTLVEQVLAASESPNVYASADEPTLRDAAIRPITKRSFCDGGLPPEGGYSPTWISVQALDHESDMYQRIVGARPPEELYDLATDPYQLNNVAAVAAYASVRDALATELDAELRRTGDPRVDGRHEEVFYAPHRENARLRNR